MAGRDTALLINISTRQEMRAQLHDLAALHLGKNPSRIVGSVGPRDGIGILENRKILLSLLGIKSMSMKCTLNPQMLTHK